MSYPAKRKKLLFLPLQKQLETIFLAEVMPSHFDVAVRMNVPENYVDEILLRKDLLLKYWKYNPNVNPDIHLSVRILEDVNAINDLLIEWKRRSVLAGLEITDEYMLSKAKNLKNVFRLTSFFPTEEWLKKFNINTQFKQHLPIETVISLDIGDIVRDIKNQLPPRVYYRFLNFLELERNEYISTEMSESDSDSDVEEIVQPVETVDITDDGVENINTEKEITVKIEPNDDIPESSFFIQNVGIQSDSAEIEDREYVEVILQTNENAKSESEYAEQKSDESKIIIDKFELNNDLLAKNISSECESENESLTYAQKKLLHDCCGNKAAIGGNCLEPKHETIEIDEVKNNKEQSVVKTENTNTCEGSEFVEIFVEADSESEYVDENEEADVKTEKYETNVITIDDESEDEQHESAKVKDYEEDLVEVLKMEDDSDELDENADILTLKEKHQDSVEPTTLNLDEIVDDYYQRKISSVNSNVIPLPKLNWLDSKPISLSKTKSSIADYKAAKLYLSKLECFLIRNNDAEALDIMVKLQNIFDNNLLTIKDEIEK